jgi:hypothetical protein
MDQVRRRVSPQLQNVEAVADQLTKLQEYRKNLELLAPAGLSPGTLAGLRLAYLAPGWVPRENLLRLEQALEHLHHALIPLVQEETRTLVLMAGLATDRETLDRALKGPSSSRFTAAATGT